MFIFVLHHFFAHDSSAIEFLFSYLESSLKKYPDCSESQQLIEMVYHVYSNYCSINSSCYRKKRLAQTPTSVGGFNKHWNHHCAEHHYRAGLLSQRDVWPQSNSRSLCSYKKEKNPSHHLPHYCLWKCSGQNRSPVVSQWRLNQWTFSTLVLWTHVWISIGIFSFQNNPAWSHPFWKRWGAEFKKSCMLPLP